MASTVEVPSFGRSRYFETFVDDASKKVVVFFQEQKNQTFEAFQKFKATTERLTGKKLKVIQTDTDNEYVNKSFRQVLKREVICYQTTCPSRILSPRA